MLWAFFDGGDLGAFAHSRRGGAVRQGVAASRDREFGQRGGSEPEAEGS